MNFRKFKSNSYCVGRRRKSATKNIYGDITSIGSRVLIGFCSFFQKNLWLLVMILCKQKVLLTFFENLGKKYLLYQKNGKKLIKKPGRALEIGANAGSAIVSRNSKTALPNMPEVINFYHTGKNLYLGKFVCFGLCKWNGKQTDCTNVHH